MAKIKVKYAKIKLQSLIDELSKVDENVDFLVELDDNCGGWYIDDITKFKLNMKFVESQGKVWLTNME